MSTAVCSICEEKSRVKLGGFYWRWVWPSGDLRGYRQLIDPVCAGSIVNNIKLATAQPDNCVKCEGKLAYPASVRVNGYAFLPGRDRLDFEVPYCETCFVEEEELYIRNAKRLDNGVVEGGGASALSPQEDPWAGLGLAVQT